MVFFVTPPTGYTAILCPAHHTNHQYSCSCPVHGHDDCWPGAVCAWHTYRAATCTAMVRGLKSFYVLRGCLWFNTQEFSMHLMVLSLRCWVTYLSICTNKCTYTYTHRTRTSAVYATLAALEALVTLINTIALLVPNVVALALPCTAWSPLFVWMSWLQWSCWNALLLLWCFAARCSVCIAEATPGVMMCLASGGKRMWRKHNRGG